MTSNQLVVGAAVLWWSCASAATAADAFPAAVGGQVTSTANAAEGLSSLADISRIIDAQGLLLSSGTPFDLLGAWMTGGDRAEGRGKKPKPAMMAMTMAGAAAASMLMMKAMAAIMLFIVHAFFATKLGLVVGAYLLASKLVEMKQSPAKKSVQVKYVSAPPQFDEHPPQMLSHYPDAGLSSYEPQQEPHHQQPSDQYGPPPQQQHYMSSGDFGGGGGDMQAHYSYLSPVTYRPTMVNRNQSDNMVKSARAKP